MGPFSARGVGIRNNPQQREKDAHNTFRPNFVWAAYPT